MDPYRLTIAWENEDNMFKELAEHKNNIRHVLTKCKLLILTVGQAGIWYNKKDGYVYSILPPKQVFNEDIHAYRQSTFQENLNNLERIFELFSKHNPSAQIIITVSPVPAHATFENENCVIYNNVSKSMLRCVVDEFVKNHPESVSYFPAYELVTVIDKRSF